MNSVHKSVFREASDLSPQARSKELAMNSLLTAKLKGHRQVEIAREPA
jgi:hypothetical protein